MSDKPKLDEVTYQVAPDAIKVFEPSNKDPVDQINTLVSQYEDMQKQGAAPENYVGAFDSSTDQFHVQTGNANVIELDSLRNMFSTAPELRDDGPQLIPVLVWLGIGFLAYKLFMRGK